MVGTQIAGLTFGKVLLDTGHKVTGQRRMGELAVGQTGM